MIPLDAAPVLAGWIKEGSAELTIRLCGDRMTVEVARFPDREFEYHHRGTDLESSAPKGVKIARGFMVQCQRAFVLAALESENFDLPASALAGLGRDAQRVSARSEELGVEWVRVWR